MATWAKRHNSLPGTMWAHVGRGLVWGAAAMGAALIEAPPWITLILLAAGAGHAMRARRIGAGVAGENTVARIVERHAPQDAILLRDVVVRAGGEQAQLDLVALGPPGALILEVKRWRAGNWGLAARQLSRAIRIAQTAMRVPVAGIVIAAGSARPPRAIGVTLGELPAALRAWAEQPAAMSRREAERLARRMRLAPFARKIV